MQVEFHNSFNKDIDKIKDKKVKNALLDIINEVKASDNLADIKNIKKLKGAKNFYRIRLGDYRIGIEINNTKVAFIRFLLRKDIYKYFP
jgi:mRNA interferase RelE/StbE